MTFKNAFKKTIYLSLTFSLCACSVVANSFQSHWPIAFQGPLSMEFSRQENWSWFPGTEPISPVPPGLAGRFFTTAPPEKLGRGVRNGNPLQYSCLENSMDRGSWQTTVHGVTKSQTRLSKEDRGDVWRSLCLSL